MQRFSHCNKIIIKFVNRFNTMRLLTTQLLVYFVCSIQASLVLFTNSFNDCTPPTKPVCSINDVYCDNNSNNPQYSNTNFNAAFVVSEAEKNADGSYNVVGNYQAAHCLKIWRRTLIKSILAEQVSMMQPFTVKRPIIQSIILSNGQPNFAVNRRLSMASAVFQMV